MALVRWDPVREIDTLQGEMNRLFSTFFDTPTNRGGNGATAVRRWIPAMDLIEAGEHFVLKADLPGMTEADVNIEVENNVLTVSGERKTELEDKHEGYYRLERTTRRVLPLAHAARGHRRRRRQRDVRQRRARGAHPQARADQAAARADRRRRRRAADDRGRRIDDDAAAVGSRQPGGARAAPPPASPRPRRAPRARGFARHAERRGAVDLSLAQTAVHAPDPWHRAAPGQQIRDRRCAADVRRLRAQSAAGSGPQAAPPPTHPQRSSSPPPTQPRRQYSAAPDASAAPPPSPTAAPRRSSRPTRAARAPAAPRRARRPRGSPPARPPPAAAARRARHSAGTRGPAARSAPPAARPARRRAQRQAA